MLFYFLLIIIFVLILDILKERIKQKKKRKKNSYRRRYTPYSTKKYDKNKRRGEVGERKLFEELSLKIPGDKYILTNLYTFKDNQKRNEIDVILIHSTGIYVIESKNYHGYINGNRFDKEWNQTFYTKSQKITKKFYNPTHQNYGHICSLQEMLGLNNKSYFKSYIAFGNDAHIEHVLYADEELRITNYNNIINHIIDDISQKRNIFTYDQMSLYYYKLKPFCHKNDDVTEQHIENVKEKITS